jgi:hypothetical protein
VNVQARHLRDPTITTPSEKQRLQACEQPSLPLIEKAQKQDDRGLALFTAQT